MVLATKIHQDAYENAECDNIQARGHFAAPGQSIWIKRSFECFFLLFGQMTYFIWHVCDLLRKAQGRLCMPRVINPIFLNMLKLERVYILHYNG